jgi:adenosylmethionine-8-amino-7-oxononanoate aminotransferase
MDTDALLALDRKHAWHPFTALLEWLDPDVLPEPPVIVAGNGALLRDSRGHEYIDGNSSIWTNLHGHNHPRLNAAIVAQLKLIAHSSFLGATHPLAIELARELVSLWPAGTLSRVFFSDDGSTAIESALRLARQFHQFNGAPERRAFVAFDQAYHGDTLGAAGLGGIPLFHDAMKQGGEPLEVIRVRDVNELVALEPARARRVAAAVIEPLIQGAAGMRIWPAGMLRRLREWCDANGVLLIADEVMTGFGRTGSMFACEQEEVVPDFLCLAKGLSAGYLPIAATLTTERVFDAFRGEPGERRAFYYGHSYTANALGCAVALENLKIFREENVVADLQPKIARLAQLLSERIAPLPDVLEIRQCGFIVGIELRSDREVGLAGHAACHVARRHGLLTRPIGDVIVFMPPYCISDAQQIAAVEAMRAGISGSTCPESMDKG